MPLQNMFHLEMNNCCLSRHRSKLAKYLVDLFNPQWGSLILMYVWFNAPKNGMEIEN